jgi:hypothetical protein
MADGTELPSASFQPWQRRDTNAVPDAGTHGNAAR